MANENNSHDFTGRKRNSKNYNKRKHKHQNHELTQTGPPKQQQNSYESQHSSSYIPSQPPPVTLLRDQRQKGDNDQTLSRGDRTTTPPPQSLQHEHVHSTNPYKSPRKEAISRYKQDQSNSSNQLYDLKDNLKSNDDGPRRGQLPDLENSDIPSLPQSLDDKINLFRYKSVEILEIANQNNINGSLLAHGVFEVFQLHRGDVTFLSCGSTFVYPLLSKTKILRINSNQFMLPLTKPERYWKISLHCDDFEVINSLVNVLQKNVQFISLYEQEELKEELNIDSVPKELQSPRNQYILNDIPDSPPSPPISPLTYLHSPVQFASAIQQPPQSSILQMHVPKKESIETLNSNIASLDINLKLLLHQPIPGRLNVAYSKNHHFVNYSSNKYTTIDEKSESSMDSLLDEYEQNLNKSTVINLRPPTRQPSIASTQHIQGFAHKNDNVLAQYYPIENKVHNYLRSRRSSRSELYTSESGWMEPNLNHLNQNGTSNSNNVGVNSSTMNGRKIPKSRSTYSINSVTTDLHSIYRNIQLRNGNNARGEEDSKSIKSMSRLPSTIKSSMPRSELNKRRQSVYGVGGVDRKNDVKLDSREIYKMLSTKPDKPILRQPSTGSMTTPATKSTSFTSRLFGW